MSHKTDPSFDHPNNIWLRNLITTFAGLLDLFTHSWSRALLEKPPIVQLLKNFPAFYGTRKFTTVSTRALHSSLYWATSIESIPSHPSSLRSTELIKKQIYEFYLLGYKNAQKIDILMTTAERTSDPTSRLTATSCISISVITVSKKSVYALLKNDPAKVAW
jgi:hypothetical protein